ncbi:MAG: glycosyltransferase [Spirochaetales bacterium]|nr:glycosyltransferase [Spirochaetales bacterium]
MKVIVNSPINENLWGIALNRWVKKKFSSKKYQYLLKELFIAGANSDIEVAVYLNRKGNILAYFVFLFWMHINGFQKKNIKLVCDFRKIDNYDYMLTTARSLLSNERYIGLRDRKKVKIIAHLSHYMNSTSEKAKIASLIKPDYYIAENNLKKNSDYFNKYFKDYNRDVYVLPFVPQERFNNLKEFSKRKNKCVALGSLSIFPKETQMLKDFFSFFGVDTYHPMRKELFYKKDVVENEIDVFINHRIDSDGNIPKNQNYYAMDIVKLYNDYKIVIVPEEANNLPSIGFVEAMACGCVIVGLDSPIYREIGMIPEHHFIAYNGTIIDLKSKIQFYQLNKDKLEEIANNSYRLVQNSFQPKTVAERFFCDLENAQNNKTLKSSFVIIDD